MLFRSDEEVERAPAKRTTRRRMVESDDDDEDVAEDAAEPEDGVSLGRDMEVGETDAPSLGGDREGGDVPMADADEMHDGEDDAEEREGDVDR